MKAIGESLLLNPFPKVYPKLTLSRLASFLERMLHTLKWMDFLCLFIPALKYQKGDS